MSNNTQAVNNTNRIQQSQVKTAIKAGKESPVNFNALFADAMGQSNPRAQLTTFETQMREALGKQDERQAREPESNPLAGEAAQSMVWAQRNWASQQNMDQEASQPGNRMEAASAEKQPAQASAQASTQAKTPEKSSDAQTTAESSADSNSASAELRQQPAQASAQSQSPTDSEQAPSAGLSTVVNQTTTAAVRAQADSLNPQAMAAANQEPTAITARETVDQTQLASIEAKPADGAPETALQDLARSEQSADQRVSNADISAAKGRELPAQDKLSAIANPIAAQNVTAQLGQQRAAVVGNSDAIEVQTLKAGDQKLTTTNGNPIAGLATTLGNGPKAATQTLIKTPVNQPGFARELGQTVNWALGRGMSTVDIRVNPESFGPMNMRLVQKGQQVQLIIRTQDEASANLMTQAIAGLKETLAQSGLNLQQVQVQHSQTGSSHSSNPSFQQSMQGSGNGQQSGSDSRSGQSAQGQNASTGQDDTVSKTAVSRNTSKTGGIDLFA